MKNKFKQTVLKLALAAVFVIGIVALGVNAYAGTATGVTAATVLIPIAVANNTTLDFGKFTNVVNTIVVTPANGRTATASNSLLTLSPSTAGQLTVTGDGSATYTIALTPAVLTKVLSTETMTLSLLTIADSTTPTTLITSGTLAGGSQILKIGGTLAVSAAQAAGTYAGTYGVVVEYN